jgi:hypothetical protein
MRTDPFGRLFFFFFVTQAFTFAASAGGGGTRRVRRRAKAAPRSAPRIRRLLKRRGDCRTKVLPLIGCWD